MAAEREENNIQVIQGVSSIDPSKTISVAVNSTTKAVIVELA